MSKVLSWGVAGVLCFGLAQGTSAQTYGDALTGMPRELEIAYALSALPPHLRDSATVWVLDLAKGYVLARQGTNGFNCFVGRTEFSREHFANNLFVPVGYDPEGSKTYLPIYFDVARLRIEGKTNPAALRQLVETRLRQGVYHAPARPGVAYMLSPIITAYHGAGSKEVMTVSMPHLMFYAPNLSPADFGAGPPRGVYPYGFDVGPLGYMIENIGAAEKAKIVDDAKDLLRELCAFRDDLCIDRLATTSH